MFKKQVYVLHFFFSNPLAGIEWLQSSRRWSYKAKQPKPPRGNMLTEYQRWTLWAKKNNSVVLSHEFQGLSESSATHTQWLQSTQSSINYFVGPGANIYLYLYVSLYVSHIYKFKSKEIKIYLSLYI